MSASETIEIAGVKFAEGKINARQFGPSVRFIGRDNGPSSITFNADVIKQHPELAGTERVRMFLASGPKPIIAIFPADAGDGVRFGNERGSGQQRPRKIIRGSVLRALSAYRTIEYRVEPITSPRKGWQLVPLTSEKKGGVS